MSAWNREGVAGVQRLRSDRLGMFRGLVAGVLVLTATAGCTATTADEVVTKLGGAPGSDHFVWAAWTDTDEGLAELWREFGLTPGSQPDVRERPVVLVATGESGSCPLTIREVVVDRESLVLDLAEDSRDGACTADFNPVTWVLVPDSDVLRPPLVVDFGDTSVLVEEADTVAAAHWGEGDDWALRPAG